MELNKGSWKYSAMYLQSQRNLNEITRMSRSEMVKGLRPWTRLDVYTARPMGVPIFSLKGIFAHFIPDAFAIRNQRGGTTAFLWPVVQGLGILRVPAKRAHGSLISHKNFETTIQLFNQRIVFSQKKVRAGTTRTHFR